MGEIASITVHKAVFAVGGFIGGLVVMYAVVYFLGIGPLKTSWGGPSIDSSVPSTVYVRGNVGMVDDEKHAVLITFIDQASGQRYHESVNSSGLYNIGLPNGIYDYVVRIQWEASDGTTGTCDGGTLSYVTQADARESFNTGC